MKIYQLLFFLILSLYLTEDDTCSINFINQLNEKCKLINNTYCKRNDPVSCAPTGCDTAGDETTCYNTLPREISKWNSHRCNWETEGTISLCKEIEKTCDYYNIFHNAQNPKGNDNCESLKHAINKKCVLVSQSQCSELPDDCDEVATGTDCTNIQPSDFTQKCVYDFFPSGSTTRKCHKVTKNCGEGELTYGGANICPRLTVSTSGMKCINFEGKCKEAYPSCISYTTENTCKQTFYYTDSNGDTKNYKNMPLNILQNEYDYSQKCVWDKIRSSCKEDEVKCSDYNSNEKMCLNLKRFGQDIQKCVYDSGNSKCIEKYPSCELYNSNETGKDRDKCKNSLIKEDSECEYTLGNDQCKTKEKQYSTCSEYNETGEKDRVICESIKTTSEPFYCVLDKDNQCIQRELNCSEVYDKDDCLHIAKAGDPNKKCAWDESDDFCYEDYIRCEDYIGTSSSGCNNIILYNGQKCEYDSQSNKCTTKFKECSEARTKEECKLIAKTGVSNPDRKVCDFIDRNNNNKFDYNNNNNECQEIFKYCSDYRGTDPNICKNIKPYREDGENIDELYRCEFEEGINHEIKKCQKVPKYCSDGNDNPILCAKISDNLKDKSIKYCRYEEKFGSSSGNNKCIATYKTCESYKENSTFSDSSKQSICEGIIPEKYNTPSCKYEKDLADNIYKCVPKDKCSEFNPQDNIDKYQELCNQSPNCGYDTSSLSCKTVERSCEEIRFYSGTVEDNQQICNQIEVSKPYKICALREDNSGCEEKYRELSFSTATSSYKEPPGSQSEESGFMVGGIHLMIILLSLLF